jgi:phosphinothricin acetyltransferase
MEDVLVRPAELQDAESIATIYNEGIADRIATFETRPRTAQEIERWFDGTHPIVVAIIGGRPVAFASTSTYRDRPCYAGVAEFSVYVAREFRSAGIGRLVLHQLIADAERAGFWKLLSRIFPENMASRRLVASVGFREVGVYKNHGKLDGIWKDTVIVERLLESKVHSVEDRQ